MTARSAPTRRTRTTRRTWAARCGALLATGAAAATLGVGTAAATPAPAPAASGSPTPCAVTAKACADLSAGRAWLTDGRGTVTAGPFDAGGGTDDDPTPVGTFTVQWKDADHVSSVYDDAPMPDAVFFTDTGVAFHGGDPDASSHGCLHLDDDAAATFFDALSPGDEVQVVS